MTSSNPFAAPTGAVPFGAPPEAARPEPGRKPRWRHRASAALLDLFALSLLGTVVNGLLLLVGAPAPHGVQTALGVLGALVGLALGLALYVRQGRTGGTYGKDLVGLRLLDVRTGEPIGTVPGLLRPVAHLADTVFLVGFARPLWNKQGKTFADTMQRSIVVRSEPRATPLGQGPLVALSVVAVLLYAALAGAALRVGQVRAEPARSSSALPAPATTPSTTSPRTPTTAPAAPSPRAARIVDGSSDGEPGAFHSRTVPAATAYTDAAAGLSRQHGLFTSDDHVFELAVVTPDPELDHALFDRLLKAQRDRAAATS